MAEDDLQEDDEAEAAAPASGRPSRKKLVILAIPMVVLLAVAALFSGVLDPIFGGGTDDGKGESAHAKPATYYDLPEMLVNLNSSGRKTNFLKLVVSLELENEGDIAQLELVMPRIIDNFQVYLRELRIEDLRGSAGVYRLREELLARVNGAGMSVHVNDVLFKEMLVQ